jgi:hypothetical protein
MSEELAQTRPAKRGLMLPGLAGICMFLIFLTMVNVYASLQGIYGGGPTRYALLMLCTILAVGIFGLLRLKKWGWAIVCAGCLLLSAGDLYLFSRFHQVFFLVRGIFILVFFLYLVRTEVRERLL